MNFRSFIFFAVIALLLLCDGCINREEAKGEEEEPGELMMNISSRPDNPFVADSVFLIVNNWGSSDAYMISLSAFEYPSPMNIFSFTVTGIALPGNMLIDSTTTFGAACYLPAEGKVYRSQLSGGGGTVQVSEFEPEVRITGSFNFTLIDTLSGEILTIDDGTFDAAIDQSLYLP